MDPILGLPTTNCGHDSTWVVIDCLTKMCLFVPTKAKIKTLELAWLFVENIYQLYGLPTNMITSRIESLRATFEDLYSKIWILCLI